MGDLNDEHLVLTGAIPDDGTVVHGSPKSLHALISSFTPKPENDEFYPSQIPIKQGFRNPSYHTLV
jgi:hypothetical protein